MGYFCAENETAYVKSRLRSRIRCSLLLWIYCVGFIPGLTLEYWFYHLGKIRFGCSSALPCVAGARIEELAPKGNLLNLCFLYSLLHEFKVE